MARQRPTNPNHPQNLHPAVQAPPPGQLSVAELREIMPPQSAPERLSAVRELKTHMVDISGSSSGSDPSLYLSPEDAELLTRFVAHADSLGWPGSVEKEMQSAREVGVPAWRSSRTVAKSGLQKALFFPRHHRVPRGYDIGRLGVDLPGTQRVAICDDGKLRAIRGRELPRSKAFGWGALPDPKLLTPALAPGNAYGVDYSNRKSKSLEQLLTELLGTKLPPAP